MAEKTVSKAAGTAAEDKKRAIETAMQQIERAYGKGSIMRYGDGAAAVSVEAISTGSLALDLALGVGGLPRGRRRRRRAARSRSSTPSTPST